VRQQIPDGHVTERRTRRLQNGWKDLPVCRFLQSLSPDGHSRWTQPDAQFADGGRSRFLISIPPQRRSISEMARRSLPAVTYRVCVRI
jgi:hypothetical protein